MPIRRYRSIEEMKGPKVYASGSKEAIEAMVRILDLGTRIRKGRFNPGVYRFRSAQEMFDSAPPKT